LHMNFKVFTGSKTASNDTLDFNMVFNATGLTLTLSGDSTVLDDCLYTDRNTTWVTVAWDSVVDKQVNITSSKNNLVHENTAIIDKFLALSANADISESTSMVSTGLLYIEIAILPSDVAIWDLMVMLPVIVVVTVLGALGKKRRN
jgi:hypothetical protein